MADVAMCKCARVGGLNDESSTYKVLGRDNVVDGIDLRIWNDDVEDAKD